MKFLAQNRICCLAASATISSSMRLLNTDTIELKNFTVLDQEYGILSHTWGSDDEEVSFQEMTANPLSPTTTSKPGFRKIQNTCERVKTLYNLQWVWIDSCCIDKTSSAELSEAINSMFRYYQEAKVCLAVLVDFDEDMETFSRSRWFTRGWTLQELVAPSEVHFFDMHWSMRGTKKELVDRISSITKVPLRVLLNDIALEDIPIAVKMSWASLRQTTREEDIAYCLLGIFDINMPMLYGEGKKAFVRLQEEIIKQSTDLSIFAWADRQYDYAFSGLLAKSPAAFQNMNHCDPMILGPDCEYQISNRGIRIDTYLLSPDIEQYILPLRHRGENGHIGVPLQRINGHLFVRSNPNSVAHITGAAYTKTTITVAKTLTKRQSINIEKRALRVCIPQKDFEVSGSSRYGCFNKAEGLMYIHFSESSFRYLEFKRPEFHPFAVICYMPFDSWYVS